MIKRYLTDIISIAVLVLFIPILVINRPDISYNEQPATRHIPGVKERAEEKGMEKVTRTAGFPHIEERNIFSPDGAYIIKGKTLLTGASYRLIGVLTSGLKRAVFVDNEGGVFILKEGERLYDGSVISRIDNISVTLKRGKTKRELKIFNIEKRR
jgi:hypothetical protein